MRELRRSWTGTKDDERATTRSFFRFLSFLKTLASPRTNLFRLSRLNRLFWKGVRAALLPAVRRRPVSARSFVQRDALDAQLRALRLASGSVQRRLRHRRKVSLSAVSARAASGGDHRHATDAERGSVGVRMREFTHRQRNATAEVRADVSADADGDCGDAGRVVLHI